MSDCIDLALQAVFDDTLSDDDRIYAARCVFICGTIKQKRKVGTSIVGGGWPERVIRNILPELLPEAINLEQFRALAHSLTEVPRSVHGIGYALQQTVKCEAVSSEQKVLIRDDFTHAIWKNRTAESRIYKAHSRYEHFTDSVITACYETVSTASEKDSNWSWCLAVAFHFGERRTSIIARKETIALRELLFSDIALREAFFWACLYMHAQDFCYL